MHIPRAVRGGLRRHRTAARAGSPAPDSPPPCPPCRRQGAHRTMEEHGNLPRSRRHQTMHSPQEMVRRLKNNSVNTRQRA
eukprot:66271-Rhodomonas_salina.3